MHQEPEEESSSLIAVFWDPAGAFGRLKEKPWVWFWLVANALFAALPLLAFAYKSDARAVLTKQLRVAGQYDKMPEQTREQVLEYASLIVDVVAPLGAVLGRLIWVFLVAVIAWGFLRGPFKALRLRDTLAVVAFASVPLFLADVLTTLTFLLKDLRVVQELNPIQSNPAAWFGLDPQQSILGTFLRRLDFFRIWNLVLIWVSLNVLVSQKNRLAYIAPLLVYAIATVSDISSAVVAQISR